VHGITLKDADINIKRVGAWLLLLLIFLSILLLAAGSIYHAYRTMAFYTLEFWVALIILSAMGFYWTELLSFFHKHKIIALFFAALIFFIGNLGKSNRYPIIENTLYLAPLTPLTAMIRGLISEYSERDKRKTIFSNIKLK